MKSTHKLLASTVLAGAILALGSGLAQAAPTWLTTPILGYDSFYDGNVNIISGPLTTVIPHSFLPPSSDPLDGVAGSPSMSVFTIGQQVHTGSGVYVDNGVSYNLSMIFTDLTNPAQSHSYTGSFPGSDGFWMTWNSPTGTTTIPGVTPDGGGVPTLTSADIGNWQYTETYSYGDGATLTNTTPFTVEASQSVPEPASLALLALGLVGLGFSQRRKQV